MKKMTFTLDEAAAREIDRAAERLDISKSQVVREAVRAYGEQLGRLSDQEREAKLRDELSRERSRLKDELIAQEQRRDLLTELVAARQERLRHLTETLASAGLPQVTLLSEKLEVPEGWAQSLDLYLGERADAAILPGDEDGLRLARFLLDEDELRSLPRGRRLDVEMMLALAVATLLTLAAANPEFAGGGAHRPPVEAQKIVRHLAVPQLDRAVPGGHAVKLLADPGGLANGIEQHFRGNALKQRPRVILLVDLVGFVRVRG